MLFMLPPRFFGMRRGYDRETRKPAETFADPEKRKKRQAQKRARQITRKHRKGKS